MATTLAEPRSTRRERWAWYWYDFGNSAYAAVVLLAVYSAYFQGTVVGGEQGTRLWGIAVGIAMLFVAVTAPILGTIADYSGSKKKFLFFYTSMAVIFCGSLFFVSKGNVILGMVLFILAEIGYRSSQVFYNALLPEIASGEDMARVSGNGWAWGSLGGIICLIIVLAAVTLIKVEGTIVVQSSLIFTALFFAVSAIPIFAWLKERAQPQELPAGQNYISLAFKRLGDTFQSVKHFREFIKFIVAFLVYNDGILMALDFAAILGAVLYGMEQTELIIFMIIVQVTSVAGAYLFGFLADEFTGKVTLYISLVGMIAAVVWMYFNRTILGFYFIGGLAGFMLTGVQSVSRTMVGTFAPEGKSAEFFGFFAVAGRTSSFIGPTIYGIAAAEAALWFQRNRGLNPDLAHEEGLRFALLTIIAFLVAGAIVLAFVNEKKARAAAESYIDEAAAAAK